MLREKLATLKETSKMTVRQIAEKSGVPVSTVTRVLSGETMNPSFDVLRAIVVSMGGSMDEIADLAARPAQTPAPAPAPAPQLPDYQQLMIPFYERALATKDKWINRLSIALAVLVAIFLCILIFDLCVPAIGYITY